MHGDKKNGANREAKTEQNTVKPKQVKKMQASDGKMRETDCLDTKDYTERWINQRLQTIEIRNRLRLCRQNFFVL